MRIGRIWNAYRLPSAAAVRPAPRAGWMAMVSCRIVFPEIVLGRQ